MAGRGPAPGTSPQRKGSTKRRRNAEPEFAPVARDVTAGKHPALPKKYRLQIWDQAAGEHKTLQVPFYATTRRWYETWAKSPIAIDFTLVHFLRLQDLAVLKDRYDRGDLTVASELRQGLAAFGGTPYDLRRLGKKVTDPETTPASPRGATVHRLRAVDPDAVAGG